MATPVDNIPTALGDVTSAANITDNSVVRGDGGAKGIQESTMDILDSGLMQSRITNYETLVTADDDIPNKKYVDDLAASDVISAAVITDHAITRGDGGTRGVQDSNLILDDNDNITRDGGITSLPKVVNIANDGTLGIGVSTYAGKGEITVGDDEEHAEFTFTSAGVVHIASSSGNVTSTLGTAASFNIYDNGTGVGFQNRLGAAKNVRYSLEYSTP